MNVIVDEVVGGLLDAKSALEELVEGLYRNVARTSEDLTSRKVDPDAGAWDALDEMGEEIDSIEADIATIADLIQKYQSE